MLLGEGARACPRFSEIYKKVKGMFQQRIYRSLGLAAHLGCARLVIDRTKANIRCPPGNSPGAADPAEDGAFENGNITNPDRVFAVEICLCGDGTPASARYRPKTPPHPRARPQASGRAPGLLGRGL